MFKNNILSVYFMDKKILNTLNYYDGIAKGYLELYHDEQIKKIKNIVNYLPKNGMILDLGCADGVINQFISNEVKLISVDLSFELLKLNTNNLKLNASILHLPLKSEKFDFVVSFTVFQDLPSIKISVEEVYRIMKNDAILIISFLHMSSKVDELIYHLEKNFKLLDKIKETKDHILVLKKILN